MTTATISDRLRAYAFLSKYLPGLHRTEQQRGLCQIRDGEVIAAAVYDEWNGHNVFVHLAGKPDKRWMTREFLYWGFHYPFYQLGARRMTAWVEDDNLASRRFVEHTGWTHEATLKGASSRGGDVLLYVMFREDCRYGKELSDKRVRSSDRRGSSGEYRAGREGAELLGELLHHPDFPPAAADAGVLGSDAGP